jgi:hypothetical protein
MFEKSELENQTDGRRLETIPGRRTGIRRGGRSLRPFRYSKRNLYPLDLAEGGRRRS